MKGIDLYSGIGGWSLGAKLAGIDIVRALEWWEPACETYRANIGEAAVACDIRDLDFSTLPKPGSVQVVVGSPPCTEFSYANRGGNGDLADGLKDVEQFLEIVNYLKPEAWAMENVPRLAGIVSTEIGKSGKLARFRSLIEVNEVFLMSDYGIPQRRSRCILGSFPVDLLRSYKGKYQAVTLGSVIESLAQSPARDPVYGNVIAASGLSNHDQEPYLSEEEERLNRAAKCFHPVYNSMNFPDSPDKVARTITATNTRVSRESIIVAAGDCYRRLTLREQACIQTFPASYQFAGTTYSQLQRMIGNAVPPLFTYQICKSMSGATPDELDPILDLGERFPASSMLYPSAVPDSRTTTLRPNRNFRFAIPHLRFGSGIRFELGNEFADGACRWQVKFYYGTSRNIIEGRASLKELGEVMTSAGDPSFLARATAATSNLNSLLAKLSASGLQEVWTKRVTGYSPLQLLDELGRCSHHLIETAPSTQRTSSRRAAELLFPNLNRGVLQERSLEIVTGAFLAATFRAYPNLTGIVEAPTTVTRPRPVSPQLALALT